MIEGNGPGALALGEEDRALAVAAVKTVLRVTNGDEDALVATLAEAALGLAEQFTGQVLIARTLRERMPVSPAWQRLSAAPVRAISGVETVAGVALAAGAYAIDIDAVGDGWVRIASGFGAGGGAPSVIAVFEAGVAAGWTGLPAPVRQGVVLLTTHLFDARGESVAPPAAVTALWRPFRRIALVPGARAC